MASLNELKEALLHTLASKGSLGQMKARIRSEIFDALDSTSSSSASPQRPPLSNTNLLINELVREYLAYNQYRYSLNVFLPEANQPEVPPFDREFIANELHVQENHQSVQIPLLYSIVALLQQNKVGEVPNTGVPFVDESAPAAAASAYSSASPPSAAHPAVAASSSHSHPHYSGGSLASSMQPGHPSAHASHHQQQPPHSHRTHAAATQSQSSADADAPRPLHFVNRI